MNTLNYIGSKCKILECLSNTVESLVPNLKEKTFGDLFAGTGTVGFHFSKKCKQIFSNDLEYYSYVINYALLKSPFSSELETIIDDCNKLEPIEGIIYKNFSPNDSCERMFFTPENAKKCDAIRTHIEKLYKSGKINEKNYYFLLASLCVSFDKVANTTSVYGAYLKQFKQTALKPLLVVPIHTEKTVNENNQVFNDYIENVVKNIKPDIVYLDPPYTARQYGANYSPLNYLCRYKNDSLRGKTGLLKYNTSNFSKKTNIVDNFKAFVDSIASTYVFLSYSSDGLVKKNDLQKIFEAHGAVICFNIEYNKYSSKPNTKLNRVVEYIWFLDKTKPSSFENKYLNISKRKFNQLNFDQNKVNEIIKTQTRRKNE